MRDLSIFTNDLANIPQNKRVLITTINSYSFVLSQQDAHFKQVLCKSDILIPDGISIVYASKFLYGIKIKKIAGADLFYYEMNRLNKNGGSCFFLGSSSNILELIMEKISIEYPFIKTKFYSPPFKTEFSDEDNCNMIKAINDFQPEVLFIGMTAPKQEKWAFSHFNEINATHICCIGAVFDFYAGTVKRAPHWVIKVGFEWLYRLLREPRRMWRRYLIGNFLFVWSIFIEKFKTNNI